MINFFFIYVYLFFILNKKKFQNLEYKILKKKFLKKILKIFPSPFSKTKGKNIFFRFFGIFYRFFCEMNDFEKKK